MDRVIKSYRDLIVWQKSMAMVTAVYEITRRFPAEEMYGLTVQIRRLRFQFPAISPKVIREIPRLIMSGFFGSPVDRFTS